MPRSDYRHAVAVSGRSPALKPPLSFQLLALDSTLAFYSRGITILFEEWQRLQTLNTCSRSQTCDFLRFINISFLEL